MGGSAGVNAVAPDIRISIEGAAAIVTLGRCAQKNALTDSMRRALATAFPGFARDQQVYAVVMRSACPGVFSAGGDVRELIGMMREAPAAARRSVAEDFSLNWLLECFSKPTVALIDGLVMGSGVGISLYGTHRVASEAYQFAMPETAIGFFPDVGVAYTFARMPDEIGLYLGLTGRRIGRADAFRLGLVTHCIGRDELDTIAARLTNADPVDPLLDSRHADPGPGDLAPYRNLIADCFSAPDVGVVVDRLDAIARRTGGVAEFAASTVADLRRASPISLAVTFRHIREARALDLRHTLIRDYRLAAWFLEGGEFAEGVRAMLIDKDRRPRWQPHALADAARATDRYFAPRPGAELVLPTRQEMQAARV
jgi:enoyl-CoA hydratase